MSLPPIKVPRRIRRWKKAALATLWPEITAPDPAEDAARAEAETVWATAYAPFAPLTADADVLELACDDGRLLGLMLERAGIRSAVGVSATPAWEGDENRPAWSWRSWGEQLRLLKGSSQLEQMEPASLDLILCRDLDRAFALADIEAGLARLYDILRPGGEMIVRARCAGADGAGYGFMTPSAWRLLCLRAGFEVVETRAQWRDPADQQRLKAALAWTGDEEALAGEVSLRLVRPWEGADLADLMPRKRKRR